MKIHYDITQGTEEWHRIKWGQLGSTRSKGLFVKSDTLMIELVSEMTEEFELDDSYQSERMLIGQELEPEAIRAVEEYSGVTFITAGWIQSKYSFVGLSPDGISKCETIAVEVKCPARKKHTETCLADEIPSDNIHQCLHYFTVNDKLETLYFGSFRPQSRKPLFVKMLTRESEINLGTKARPVIKTVQEWVSVAHSEIELLEADVAVAIEALEF